jgi:AraC-like DNA-binding protein/DNA-binding NarL/FixJ family response regulator
MQMNLENPVAKAKNTVQDRIEMNAKGELELPEIASEQMTAESTYSRAALDSPTSKFTVVMIDDNKEFLKFAAARLKYVYDFHIYDDIQKAADDLEQMKCDAVLCKQDMPSMTGSDFCNQLKTSYQTQEMKFILMTDGVLTPQDMRSKNITLSADDYLAKPFNMQEATMRINQTLGLGAISSTDLIEGAETRMLEDRNTSMTTATETMGLENLEVEDNMDIDPDDPMNMVDTTIQKNNQLARKGSNLPEGILPETEQSEQQSSDYSMLDQMDQQLLKNIEQYVMQNMSRGQISLEEMAGAMGMGRVPFFHRIRTITGKTPAELVRDMRLKHACILLKRTNINMSELATNIGFMTAENFINIFREKYGMTPLEYRLKNKRQ